MVNFACMILDILVDNVDQLRISLKLIKSLFCKVVISLSFVKGEFSSEHGHEKDLLRSDAINTKYHASLYTLAVAHDVVEREQFLEVLLLSGHPIAELQGAVLLS